MDLSDPAPTSFERPIRALRRRVLLAAFLGELLRLFTLLALALGGALLVARFLFPAVGETLAWAFVLLALAPLGAWARARRKGLSAQGAAVWFDRRAGATGAVLTDVELGDPRWSERARAASRAPLPSVSVLPGVTRALLATGFAVLALLVPIRAAGHPTVVPSGVFDAPLEEIAEQLATLEEHVELEEERAAELEERLEALREEAQQAADPEGTFEALDRLAREVADESARAAERALQAQDSLAASEAAASQAARGQEESGEAGEGDEAARERTDEAREHLEQAVADLAQAGLSLELPPALAESLDVLPSLASLDASTLDASELERLAQALGEGLAGKLGELAAAGLLDPAQLAALGEGGEGDLSRYSLHECDASCDEPGGT